MNLSLSIAVQILIIFGIVTANFPGIFFFQILNYVFFS